MLKFWEDFGFTLLTAYLMYIIIEAPLGGLEGLLLPTRRPSPKPAIETESRLKKDPELVRSNQFSEKANLPQLANDVEAAQDVPSSVSAVNT